MASSRVKKLINKIERNLRNEGMRDIVIADIMAELNRSERVICRRGLALQGDYTLSLVAGTDEYAVASTIHRVTQFIEPSTWTFPYVDGKLPDGITIIFERTKWRDILRSGIANANPMFCFLWDGKLRFYPEPSVSEDVDVLVYELPSSEMTKDSVDPTISDQWDDALEFGATAGLVLTIPNKNKDVPVVDWGARFEAELRMVKSLSNPVVLQSGMVQQHFSDGLGF